MAKRSPRKRLLDELDYLWGAIIRFRDKYTCRWCGKSHIPGDSSYHASHIIPKSSGHAARYDLANGKGLCMRCHIHVWHKDPIEADRFIKTIKTDKELNYLESLRGKIVKYSDDELKEMIQAFETELETQKLNYDKWCHRETEL